MARQINNIEDHNKWVDKTNIDTIITFRTQQLFDLWINEMSGQISDGMWENARHTEWLWRNVLLRLGDETKVEVAWMGRVGRKTFGMTGELWDIIGDRIMDENGFETEKEAKRAWKEIALAIANVQFSKEIQEIEAKAKAEKQAKIKDQWPELYQEWMDAGVHESKYTSFSTFQAYIDEENKKGYISVDRTSTREGELKTSLRYDDKTYTVGKGNLAEALKTLREFATKMSSLR